MTERAVRVLPNMPNGQSLRMHTVSGVRARSTARGEAQPLGVSHPSRFESGYARDLFQAEPHELEPQHVVILMLAGGALCAWAGSVLSWM